MPGHHIAHIYRRNASIYMDHASPVRIMKGLGRVVDPTSTIPYIYIFDPCTSTIPIISRHCIGVHIFLCLQDRIVFKGITPVTITFHYA